MHRPLVVATLLSLAVAVPATAQDRDWYGRFAVSHVSIGSTSDIVGVTGSSLELSSSSPGFRFDVGKPLTLDLALEGSFSSARFDIAAAGGDQDGVSAGQLWNTSASLLLVWRLPLFGDVRPHLAGGVAISAMPYYIRDNGARSLGIRELETGVGVGPAAVVGLDYQPAPSWFVTLDVRWLDAPIDIDVVNDTGVTVDSVEMPFAPVTVGLAGGWRF